MDMTRDVPPRQPRSASLVFLIALIVTGCGGSPQSDPSAAAFVGSKDGGEADHAVHRMALSIGEPTQAGGHKPGLSQTMTILRESQWNESRGCLNSHRYFGGTGKDGRSAPDLLHTAQSLQVLSLIHI